MDLDASLLPEPGESPGSSLLPAAPKPLKPAKPVASQPVSPLAQPAPALPVQPQPDLREFGDVTKTRQRIYDNVLNAVKQMQPVSNHRYTLQLADVDYADPDRFSKREQKQAILSGLSLGRRLRGTWQLVDNQSGQVVDSKKQVLMTVPHLTERGTYINDGTEYGLKNQQRLLPGVYTRVQENGDIESHANILPGKGVSHRYYLDPEQGTFKIKIGQAHVGLLPLLRVMGTTDDELKQIWGRDLLYANQKADTAAERDKLYAKFLSPKELEGDEATRRERLRTKFENMQMDPEVNQRTLGQPFDKLDKPAILAITQKLLKVSRSEAQPDDRDSLTFQQFLGPEDLFAERIARDKGGLRRQLLWKATSRGSIAHIPSSALGKQVKAALLSSGLGEALEETNPAQIFDKLGAVSRIGEGGISSVDSIPLESRSVQPSMLGFVDPLRTPESSKAGVDTYLTRNARKGADGKLYAAFIDAKTGEQVYKTPQQAADLTVTFAGSLDSPDKHIVAMKNGELDFVKRDEIDLMVPSAEDMFNPLSNLIPLKYGTKGQRSVMASRMTTQALPLVHAEAPLVQSAVPGTNEQQSFEELYSGSMGAVRAPKSGVVVSADPDEVRVRYDDGTEETHDLYRDFALNRKTAINQTPVLQPGARFDANQVLARSNYTDATGTTALGTNARTAYMAWEGKNFEDAIVVSDSFAKKTTSEHSYQHGLSVDDKTTVGKNQFLAAFPGKYDKKTLANFDPQGLIKPGTQVNYGDPLILGVQQKELAHNKMHKSKQASMADASVTWDHHDAGVVTDAIMGKEGPVVVVKSLSETRIGDKISARYGDKGVIADIVPDHKMPVGADGRPYEVLLNPAGLPTRTNPTQMAELWLGKLAEHQGKPIKVQDFDTSREMVAWAKQKLEEAGLSSTEDLEDPTTGRRIKGVATGNRFFMKLHHSAESKIQGRGSGAYTAEGLPAKVGDAKSKRIGLLETNALLSHGATATLEDARMVRGQQNTDYWMQFMSGHTPRIEKIPHVYEKFVAQLKSAGVNVTRNGPRMNIMALTDKDISELAGDREITSSVGVDWGDQLRELPGGFFDKARTGGHGGSSWSYFKLAKPMPNPVMEEPIRRLLGLTQKKFEAVIAGQEELPRYGTGTDAITSALKAIDVDSAITDARNVIKSGRKSYRDAAVRKLGYLKSMKKMNLTPADYMLTKVPVLPPQFRPVSMMGKDMPLVDDANFLYKELFDANKNYERSVSEFGDKAAGPDAMAVYSAFKAVTGLGDPIGAKTKEKQVKGALKHVFGSSPKYGTMQRKLLSSTVDNVGRGVITPNPDLDMDSIGLPEDMAFDVYDRYVTRELVRRGMSMRQAREEIQNRSKVAKNTLVQEMDRRPVIASRAPVLHKFGIMAFKPQLVKSSTLHLSPLIIKGFGADFDGNCVTGDTWVTLRIDTRAFTEEWHNEWYYELRRRVLSEPTGAMHESDTTWIRVMTPIRALPQYGDFKLDRNGARVYEVPPGVSIASFDDVSGAARAGKITHFTCEDSHTCAEVRFKSSRVVRVSDNESLAVYDMETGRLKKVRPEDAEDKLVPRCVNDQPVFGRHGLGIDGREFAAMKFGSQPDYPAVRRFLLSASRDAQLGFLVELLRTAGVFRQAEKRPFTENYRARCTYQQRCMEEDLQILYQLSSNVGIDVAIGPAAGTNTEAATDDRRRYTIQWDVRDLLDSFSPRMLAELSLDSWHRNAALYLPPRTHDYVPVSHTVLDAFEKALPADNLVLRSWVQQTRKRGFTTRRLAKMRAQRVVHDLPGRPPEFDTWLSMISDDNVRWERVASVRPIETQAVYDLVVPETKVYRIGNGLIVYDTMNAHVPATEKAVKEAYDRLLPSKNLLSPANFSSVVHAPINEYVGGLYYASSRKLRSQRPERIFRSKADARRAYEAGELSASDPIVIAEDK